MSFEGRVYPAPIGKLREFWGRQHLCSRCATILPWWDKGVRQTFRDRDWFSHDPGPFYVTPLEGPFLCENCRENGSFGPLFDWRSFLAGWDFMDGPPAGAGM